MPSFLEPSRQVLDCRRWSNSVITSRWPALPFGKPYGSLLKKDFSSLAEGVASMSYSIRRRASLLPKPPFSIPPGRKRPPIPPGATPLGRLAASPHNGAPSALRLRRARRKRLAEGSKFESLRGGKAPSHSPTRSPRFDRPRDPQASQQLHRRRFYAKEGGRPARPVARKAPLKCQ